MEALAKIIKPAQAASEPPGKEAPLTPPSSGSMLPTPMPELNEVSMAEDKRKPEDDAEKLEDAEAMAEASLLGEDACASQKVKKTKLDNKETSATLAQTQSDVDDIMRLVNKNLRRPEDAASSSTGQQQG